jgi:heme exporter protein D
MSWSEFWSMGGYALYVWGSYLTALIVLGGEVVLLMKRQKSLRKHSSTVSSAREKPRVDSIPQTQTRSLN